MQAATEAVKAAIMTRREADYPVNNARPIHTMPWSGSPVLRQDLGSTDSKWQGARKMYDKHGVVPGVPNLNPNRIKQ